MRTVGLVFVAGMGGVTGMLLAMSIIREHNVRVLRRALEGTED